MNRTVLIVDDDPLALRLLEKHLGSAGYNVIAADEAQGALALLDEHEPPVLITDWMMPGMSGLELCRQIRTSRPLDFVYIIVLTAHGDKECLLQAFEAGADDFLAKPFLREELLARLTAAIRMIQLKEDLARQNAILQEANAELALLNQKLEEMATTDALTGLVNRREAMNRFNELWAAGDRHGQPLACILLDIDHFKNFNDTYGHDIGDLVLRETAEVIQGHTRVGETASRFGGEEFLILCPNATPEEAAVALDRLRETVQNNRIEVGGHNLTVTVSAGVAGRTPDTATPDDLIHQADQALYAAKRTGRNRVCLAGAT